MGKLSVMHSCRVVVSSKSAALARFIQKRTIPTDRNWKHVSIFTNHQAWPTIQPTKGTHRGLYPVIHWRHRLVPRFSSSPSSSRLRRRTSTKTSCSSTYTITVWQLKKTTESTGVQQNYTPVPTYTNVEKKKIQSRRWNVGWEMWLTGGQLFIVFQICIHLCISIYISLSLSIYIHVYI